MAGEKLINIIKQAIKQAIPDTSLTDLVSGIVTSINPLKIKVQNKFEVDSTFLVLSPFCYDTSLWEGLRVGDKVNMFRVSKGQKYYVMDKGAIK